MSLKPPSEPSYWPSLILAIRKANNWSQAQLAVELNTNQETISRWELGAVMPSRNNQIKIEDLAENSKISSLGGLAHIVRLSPYPMIISDEASNVLAASASSGFIEGQSVISQTPTFQHDYFIKFADAIKAKGFWSASGQCEHYHYSDVEHGEFHAVITSIRIHGSIYCVVQAIPHITD